MAIWQRLYGSIHGGWKTYGPNSIDGPGAFDGPDAAKNVNAETAIRLSAVWACQNIRAETTGALPFTLRDANKMPVTDHPLFNVLTNSPNYDQTTPEFFSLAVAHIDMFGNFVARIDRGVGKKIIALTPVDPNTCQFEYNKSGTRRRWKIDGEDFSDDDVFHVPGFTLQGGWGAPRLDIGRQILGAQIEANRSALTAFRNSLKVGGFFEVDKNPTAEQLKDFGQRMGVFARPENSGRWMTLLAGMKPIAGDQFRIKPSDAQLLESRYFGIEEICRLYNVPPPLIGHTSKSSSWSSSIENLNLFFQIYSLQPTIVRIEKRISKKLLTPYDIAEGIQPKFSMQGLLRGDLKSRTAYYASGLQNGYLSQNDVLALEDRPGIGPEGDVYRVQLNMANADQASEDNSDSNNSKGDN